MSRLVALLLAVLAIGLAVIAVACGGGETAASQPTGAALKSGAEREIGQSLGSQVSCVKLGVEDLGATYESYWKCNGRGDAECKNWAVRTRIDGSEVYWRVGSVERDDAPPRCLPKAPVVTSGEADCLRESTKSFGLTSTSLWRSTSGLHAIWKTNRSMPTTGTVLYVIDASDDSGNVSLNLGVKYLDGSQIAYYVFDFDSAYQTDLEGYATQQGNRVEAFFPQDAIADLEGRFMWRSVLNVRGDDVDSCPAGGDLPFPG